MSFPVVSSRFTHTAHSHTDKEKSSVMSFPIVSDRFSCRFRSFPVLRDTPVFQLSRKSDIPEYCNDI